MEKLGAIQGKPQGSGKSPLPKVSQTDLLAPRDAAVYDLPHLFCVSNYRPQQALGELMQQGKVCCVSEIEDSE